MDAQTQNSLWTPFSNGVRFLSLKRYLSRTLLQTALLLVTACLTMPGSHAQPLPAGEGLFVFHHKDGETEKPVKVWFFRPKNLLPDSKVVFVMPGTNRNGKTYLKDWSPFAEQHGFLLLVPEFSKQDYGREDYQFGGIGHTSPSRGAFSVIEHVFDEVKARESLTTSSYNLYGHSAGAQFVHRFVLFMPHPRLALAIAANAGDYTLPDNPGNQPCDFPWCLTPDTITETQLQSAFSQKLVVLLGEEDTDPNHKHLPNTPQAKQQGLNRLERGKTFYQCAQKKAAALKTPLNWALQTVPGVGHSDQGMAPAALALILQQSP